MVDDHNPLALQRAVFFYVSKTFCLRGGQKQRGLKPSQFIYSSNLDCYKYVENGSKNKSGVNPKENKLIPVYTNSKACPRCLVYLLDKTFQKGKDMDVSYLHPVSKKVSDDEPWYECSTVCKEKLRKYMETMCREAGITEKKTNHSLRATGTTALFSAGVPEKLIAGHKSNVLQLYERQSVAQNKAVSGILVQGKRSFAEGVDKENTSSSCCIAQVCKSGCPVQQGAYSCTSATECEPTFCTLCTRC